MSHRPPLAEQEAAVVTLRAQTQPCREFLIFSQSCLRASSILRRQETVPTGVHVYMKNYPANDIQTVTDLGPNLSLRFSLRASRRKSSSQLLHYQSVILLPTPQAQLCFLPLPSASLPPGTQGKLPDLLPRSLQFRSQEPLAGWRPI